MRFLLLLTLSFAGTFAASSAELTMENVATLPHAEIEAALPDTHAAIYYGYAARLFEEGNKEDAVLWFYVGKLRFRFDIAAHPNADPSGGPALMGSLNFTIGPLINGWAGGDIEMWTRQIDRALEWDSVHPNGITSKTEFEKEYTETRSGLEKMRQELVRRADEIRQTRAEQGLENRSEQEAGGNGG